MSYTQVPSFKPLNKPAWWALELFPCCRWENRGSQRAMQFLWSHRWGVAGLYWLPILCLGGEAKGMSSGSPNSSVYTPSPRSKPSSLVVHRKHIREGSHSLWTLCLRFSLIAERSSGLQDTWHRLEDKGKHVFSGCWIWFFLAGLVHPDSPGFSRQREPTGERKY